MARSRTVSSNSSCVCYRASRSRAPVLLRCSGVELDRCGTNDRSATSWARALRTSPGPRRACEDASNWSREAAHPALGRSLPRSGSLPRRVEPAKSAVSHLLEKPRPARERRPRWQNRRGASVVWTSADGLCILIGYADAWRAWTGLGWLRWLGWLCCFRLA